MRGWIFLALVFFAGAWIGKKYPATNVVDNFIPAD